MKLSSVHVPKTAIERLEEEFTQVLAEAKSSPWVDAARAYLLQNPTAKSAEVIAHTDSLGLDRPNHHHSRIAGVRKSIQGSGAQPASTKQAPQAAPDSAPTTAPTSTVTTPAPTSPKARGGTVNVDSWLKKHKVTNYTINEDGTVDVDGDVHLDKLEEEDHLPVNFNKVTGNFSCSGSLLTSLKGTPRLVGGGFWATHTEISDCVGGPEIVHHHYDVSENPNLKSLEGMPEIINGSLGLINSELTSLANIHKQIKEIEGHIMIEGSKITSNILGILYIKGLSSIEAGNSGDLAKACEIMNKYVEKINSNNPELRMRRSPAVVACQEELIDAGLGDFAKP